MTAPITVDASVWVSAADPTDAFAGPSRKFLAAVAASEVPVTVPTLARVEIACALARRLGSPTAGRRLASGALAAPFVSRCSLDADLLESAVEQGTDRLLRAGDAVYAATALRAGGPLVSWDDELIGRVGAVTPSEWLERCDDG